MEELVKVETVINALNVGIVAEWAQDHVGQHAMEGKYHPLAYALDHLLSYHNRGTFMIAQFLLSGELQRLKIGKGRDATDLARDSLMHWLVGLCPSCSGTGVKDIHQATCDTCNGAMRVDTSEEIKQAMRVIESHLEIIEMSLRKHMKGA